MPYSFYLGKKVAFVYRAHREIRGTKIRVIWGKVTRPHGMRKQWVSCVVCFLNETVRQLWRREGTISTQSPSKIVWCLGESDVVSIIDIALQWVIKRGRCCPA